MAGGEIEGADDRFTLRLLYAFWQLCEQRIAESEQVPPNHAAQVAAAGSGLSPEIRVVRFRQRAEPRRADSKELGLVKALPFSSYRPVVGPVEHHSQAFPHMS